MQEPGLKIPYTSLFNQENKSGTLGPPKLVWPKGCIFCAGYMPHNIVLTRIKKSVMYSVKTRTVVLVRRRCVQTLHCYCFPGAIAPIAIDCHFIYSPKISKTLFFLTGMRAIATTVAVIYGWFPQGLGNRD